MLLLAHRGASADAPENTLAAFQTAVEQGADGVELDVQICLTGEVVVCHDPRLDRLAGRPTEVLHTSWANLRRLDVGSSLGFRPERIPLLEEVLELLPAHLTVNVELKCDTVDDHGLTRATVEVIRKCRASDRVIVSSFNAFCLWRLMAYAPELHRGYLIDPERSFALHGGVLAPLVSSWSVHPHFHQVTPERLRWWKSAGRHLAVWTVDDPAEARRLRALGVEYCITNQPGVLRRELEETWPNRASAC
ncbi:MAG: glycerophosphodiester phosphodiesterase family protein [Myxococcaceae bacterium]